MENSPLNLPVLESKSDKTDSSKTEKKEKDRDKKESRKKKKAGEVALFGGSEEKEKPSEPEKKDKESKPLDELKQKIAENQPAPEEAAPTDEIGEGEKDLPRRATAEVLGNEVPEHGPEEEITEEVAGDITAKAYLEKVENGAPVDEAAVETVAEFVGDMDEARKKLHEAEEIINAEVAESAEAEGEPEAEEQVEANKELTEEVMFVRQAEHTPETEEDQPEDVTPTAATNAATATSPPSGPPPRKPTLPMAFGAGFPPSPGGSEESPLFTEASKPETKSNEPYLSPGIERYDQGNPAVAALVGGIIGYLIGRRRGRIKTEKRLVPIQKKLEKQVNDLHWEVKRKELAVRRIAAEKVRQDGPLVIQALAVNKLAKAEKKPEKPQPELRPTIERPIDRRAAPEASQLHGKNKAQELLGHILLTAESTAATSPKKPERAVPLPTPEFNRPPATATAKQEQISEHLRQRHVETLNRAELLTLSEKIIIDGASLRQIYETHLIGERGLRRLVAEYLSGGDVKKILRNEIVEHEIDFERDPALRDIALPSELHTTSSTAVTTNKIQLEHLVEKASANLGGSKEEAAYYKARASIQAHEQEEGKKKRTLIDVGLVTAIAVLAALVAILYLSRN